MYGEPLTKMQARGINMQELTLCLREKNMRWKIMKREFERIDHVVRMGIDRLTKAMVLGWYESLEGNHKQMRKKRKIMLCWKRILNECGVDCTDVERGCSGGDGWKKCVNEGISHLVTWRNGRGNKTQV